MITIRFVSQNVNILIKERYIIIISEYELSKYHKDLIKEYLLSQNLVEKKKVYIFYYTTIINKEYITFFE